MFCVFACVCQVLYAMSFEYYAQAQHTNEQTQTHCTHIHTRTHDCAQPDIARKFHNPGTISFCQKVMVGLIILFDHVDPMGAFHKKSQMIDVKACIKLLQASGHDDLENLLNALRYTTKHLNDDTTPKEIKKMLNV
eukprot:m.41334 g.41334  ORF g.41334 m.41334 type:complete len:136 (+) comp10416_c0_seq1:117-524(+)